MSKKKNNGNYKDNLIARSEEARTVRKIVSIIIISLILILVVGGISGYMYVKSALKPVDSSSKKEINVEIPMGSSTSDIAHILEEKGIIKDARVFRFYIKFQNESEFQAGEYALTKAMTLDEIIEALQKGKVMEEALYTVTIPEGKSIEQIAEIYANKLKINKEDFLTKINDPAYVEQLMGKYPEILTNAILEPDIRMPLEGYLFAATYDFYEEKPTVEAIVEKMLKKTVEVVTPYLDDIAARDTTVHEAITMASLVENEAKTVKQRKMIAGVFYNRLEDGMKLQTDPTVQYAMGEHKEKVTYKDLEIKSPYNTYYVDALPVGPISNFAESSLKATLQPEETEYKYFLHDKEGKIHYSKTNKEHNKLKDKYID
ncbi:endolytic transglycosylase MltG [Virgibacillus oceani]|uniref:Endolytic murein transglycosylase n=1 Tax=Virgibacillus oceani TaxID=1479511 RepID=A0A917LW74_9BACI|nr:endolytic transglycosylase MltG [Virgibacillus oceani]GGG62845.1 hypothetical protein GCM10011398_02800 [Virgibacillus oceani]